MGNGWPPGAVETIQIARSMPWPVEAKPLIVLLVLMQIAPSGTMSVHPLKGRTVVVHVGSQDAHTI